MTRAAYRLAHEAQANIDEITAFIAEDKSTRRFACSTPCRSPSNYSPGILKSVHTGENLTTR
jgi:hypothetical protein